jgi:hypothetical protein
MIRVDETGQEEIIISSTPETSSTEGVKITEFDPERELPDGVHPKQRSCKSCIHASVCKIFEVEALHAQRLEELAKRSNVTLNILPPEAIGAGCSAFESGTIKTGK